MNIEDTSVLLMFKEFWFYLRVFIFSIQLWMDFFLLFGGSNVEETGRENPVASSQFLKLLFLSSPLKIALLTE